MPQLALLTQTMTICGFAAAFLPACAGLLSGDYVNTSVVRVLKSINGAEEVFDVPVAPNKFRRVITIQTPRSEHRTVQELLLSHCPQWYPLKAGQDMHENAFSCNFNASHADVLVDTFMQEHASVLRAGHNVESCRPRTVIPPQPPRVYVTALSTEMAPDAWCAARMQLPTSDASTTPCRVPCALTSLVVYAAATRVCCLSTAHALPRRHRHADGCDFDLRSGEAFLTVLHYPHERWDAAWGGHLEFAAQVCTCACACGMRVWYVHGYGHARVRVRACMGWRGRTCTWRAGRIHVSARRRDRGAGRGGRRHASFYHRPPSTPQLWPRPLKPPCGVAGVRWPRRLRPEGSRGAGAPAAAVGGPCHRI